MMLTLVLQHQESGYLPLSYPLVLVHCCDPPDLRLEEAVAAHVRAQRVSGTGVWTGSLPMLTVRCLLAACLFRCQPDLTAVVVIL